MKKQIIAFIIFISSIALDVNAQTIFYNEDGLKVNKTDATSYRIYTLDKTAKKGTFKEFNMQNVLLKESGFLKFDFTDKTKQILNNKYIEYKNDSIFRINYKNNIPINQMDVYDKKNRLLQIVPIKNGKITYDDDVINYHYFEESKKNEYYTIQGKFEGDNFFGKVMLFYEPFVKAYYFNGEDFNLVNKNICFAFNYLNYVDKNKNDTLSFEDNFNCGKNNNWVLFLMSKEINYDLDYANIKNNQLFKSEKDFKAFAEKEFRNKYKIPANGSINPTGLMFENEKFNLPLNIFYTKEGLLLYYNSYEAASYADGPKELLLPYDKVNDYLLFK